MRNFFGGEYFAFLFAVALLERSEVLTVPVSVIFIDFGKDF